MTEKFLRDHFELIIFACIIILCVGIYFISNRLDRIEMRIGIKPVFFYAEDKR